LIAIDTSVLVAIINGEAEARDFITIIGETPSAISAATLLEAHCVATRWVGGEKSSAMQMLIEKLELRTVSFDAAQLDIAKSAYARFGRGSGHPANLNMGDCFSYALAKTRKLPLLFKGDDFIHTDVEPALKTGTVGF
jgi:ribonuclease VapC